MSSVGIDVNGKKNCSYNFINSMLSRCDVTINGEKLGDIKVNDARFFKRVFNEGSIGLDESYMEGWWDCEDLDVFFYKILNEKIDKQIPGNLHDIAYYIISKFFILQSISRSKNVAKVHYNLGNDLFESILDSWMQYSCAYWKDAHNLKQTQLNKLALIGEKLMLKPGMKVLDVGCGWGGLGRVGSISC